MAPVKNGVGLKAVPEKVTMTAKQFVTHYVHAKTWPDLLARTQMTDSQAFNRYRYYVKQGIPLPEMLLETREKKRRQRVNWDELKSIVKDSQTLTRY